MPMRLRRRSGWTTVRLMSGLGNQLFQYAAGRRVADRTGKKLRFDVSFFASEPNREYALGDFRIRAELVDGEPKTQAFMDDVDNERAYSEQRYGATLTLRADSDRCQRAIASARHATSPSVARTASSS